MRDTLLSINLNRKKVLSELLGTFRLFVVGLVGLKGVLEERYYG